MSSKRISKDEMFCTGDQNSKDMPKLFRMTVIHKDEMYSSKIEQCIRDIDKTGKEEMKIRQQMKSEETPDYTIDNQHLFCSSTHEATKLEDICLDKQDVVSESIPFRNNVTGDMYQCKYCAEESNDNDCLVTPCRCSGSLRYVHKHCLETWIRVRSKGTFVTELKCELCGYRFYPQEHHKWTRFSCSDLSRSDRRLYYVGIFCMLIVVGSISGLVFCFIQDSPLVKKYVESKIDKLVASSANTNEINRAIETYNLSTLDNMKIVCAVVCIIFITLCVFLAKVCKVPPHKLILGHPHKRWAALPYSASRDSLVMGNVTNV